MLDDLTTKFPVPLFVSNFSQCVLYVPESSVDIYKSSPDWNVFKDILPIVPLTGISISDDNVNLDVEESATLEIIATPVDATVTHCTWTSSDPEVASVDQNGVVTAHKAGTAIITAKSMYYSDLSVVCTVTVTSILPENILLDKTSLALKVGEEETLTVTVLPENTSDKTVTWTSSNPCIATVDTNGKVTATTVGTAIITATCGSVAATCEVIVNPIIGDANGDNAYTISDITFTANHIMGTLGVGNDFYIEAADLDCDGMVLVNDLTAIIDLVLAADYAVSAPALAPQRERVAALPVFEISETNGSAIEVCVKLGYIATQFDVILPEGARLIEASLAGNNTLTHKISYRNIGDNRVRVVVFSMDNAEMSGELISLTVQGEGDVTLTNALVNEIQPDGTIVEKAAADIHASIPGNASGISEIESDSPTSDSIYNLNGQKVSDDYKGFVIKNGKKILSK